MSDITLPEINSFKTQEIFEKSCNVVRKTYINEIEVHDREDSLSQIKENVASPDGKCDDDYKNGGEGPEETQIGTKFIPGSMNGMKISLLTQNDVQYQCLECDLSLKCKFLVHNFRQKISYICSDACWYKFSQKTGLRVSKYDLGAIKNLEVLNDSSGLAPSVPNNSVVSSAKISIRKCIECSRALVDPRFNVDTICWENMEFCDEECLEEYQKRNCSTCTLCKIEIVRINYGKFSVKITNQFKHFCGTKCLNEYKSQLNLCFFCYENLSFNVKPCTYKNFGKFCSVACLEKYDEVSNIGSKNVCKGGLCTNCKKTSNLFITFVNTDVIFKFCTKTCFDNYKYLNKIDPHKCSNCQNFFLFNRNHKFWEYNISTNSNKFCSNICKRMYLSKDKLILQCSWCKSVKYNYDMVKKIINNKEVATCTLKCLKLYQETFAIFEKSKKECQFCHNIFNNKFHVTMYDNTVYRFCSRYCVDNYFKKLAPTLPTNPNIVRIGYERIVPIVPKVQNGPEISISSAPSVCQSSQRLESNLKIFPTANATVTNCNSLNVRYCRNIQAFKNADQLQMSQNPGLNNESSIPVNLNSRNLEYGISSKNLDEYKTQDFPQESQIIEINSDSDIPSNSSSPNFRENSSRQFQSYQNLDPLQLSQSTVFQNFHNFGHNISRCLEMYKNSDTFRMSQNPNINRDPNVSLNSNCQNLFSNTSKTLQQFSEIPQSTLLKTEINCNGSQVPQSSNFREQSNLKHPFSLEQQFLNNTQTTSQPSSSKNITATRLRREIYLLPRKHPKMLNKMISCYPFKENFSQNFPEFHNMKDEASQTDPEQSEFILPVPFPFYVPMPLLGGGMPTPVPFPIAVPVPVPIFLPMKQKSAKEIMKTIEKIKETMPTDPLEAELVHMAAFHEENSSTNKYEDKRFTDTVETAMEAKEKELSRTKEDEQRILDIFEGASDSEEEDLPLSERIGCWKNEIKILKIEKVNSTGFETCFLTSGSKKEHKNDLEIDLAKSSIDKDVPKRCSKRQRKNQIEESTSKDPKLEETASTLKVIYGINAWYFWFQEKYKGTPFETKNILDLTSDELSTCLAAFVVEIRKPNGHEYFPDTVFYLCLCIQKFLVEHGKKDNIFVDDYYQKFIKVFDQVSTKFALLHETSKFVITRVEEQYLWESHQLGTFSPKIVLFSLIYLNTINFKLDTLAKHLEISFGRMIKGNKNNAPFLRYYPPYSESISGKRYTEVFWNEQNPDKCAIKLFDFYISKCPDFVRRSSSFFYLVPEKYCTEESPVWFSNKPLDNDELDLVLRRIKMVKEVNMVSYDSC